MAVVGNEFVIRNGVLIHDIEAMATNPGKYISLDADNKMIYRTGANVLADITGALTEGYVPIKSADTLVNSIIYGISGKIGINVTNPDGTLHIMSASAGTVTAFTASDDLVVENNDNGGISILTPNDNNGSIYFGSPDNARGAYVNWKYADKIFKLGSNVANGVTHILSGAGTVGLVLDGSQNVAFKGENYQYAGLVKTDASGNTSIKQYGADAAKYLNNTGEWTVPTIDALFGNYDLTISSLKSIGATTWDTIDFELPADVDQNNNGEYDDNTSTFKIEAGDTWKFDLNVSVLATEANQYIELQIYNTTNSRVITSAVLVPNGITHKQTINITGLVYADGVKDIVFRMYSNYRFEIHPDTINATLKGTCLVATKRSA